MFHIPHFPLNMYYHILFDMKTNNVVTVHKESIHYITIVGLLKYWYATNTEATIFW